MRFPTLYNFFRHQLQHGFHTHGLNGTATVDYVSDMLARFSQTQAFYALQDPSGRPLEHIVDLVWAWRAAQGYDDGRDDRARASVIVRHIGEYTLFMSGLFRERLMVRGELDYYLAHGRSAFWHSADYATNPNHRQIYRRLYQDFGPISDVLDYLRRVQFPLPGSPAREVMLAALWRV